MMENNDIEKAYEHFTSFYKGEHVNEQRLANVDDMKSFEGMLFLKSVVSETINKESKNTVEAYKEFQKKQKSRLLYIRIAMSVASCFLLMLGIIYFEKQDKLHDVEDSMAQGDVDKIYIEIGDRVYTMDNLQDDSSLSACVQIKDGKITSVPGKTDIVVMNRVNVPKGRTAQIQLPDGSKVWLNSASKLSFPSRFEETREVTIEGEAYFDVVPSGKMFIVHSGEISTKVLGTSFNCDSYNITTPCVTLIKGKVRLTSATDSADLVPGYQALVTEAGTMAIQKANIEDVTGWIDNKIIYKSVTIEEIIKHLERLYDFDVEWEDSGVKQFKFDLYGDYSETLETIIERLALTGRVRIKYENNILSISNAR